VPIRDLPPHTFSQGKGAGEAADDQSPQLSEEPAAGCASTAKTEHWPEHGPSWHEYEEQRARGVYRRRTVTMLRRYMRYSIETGRLPSLLGREFFRSKITSYTVASFEDRVIFVHDMENCLKRLDEFSRQILARHILQEHDQAETGRLLQCTERTVRSYLPMALDLLSDVLIEVGLLEMVEPNRDKPCQGGLESEFFVSDWGAGKNKV